MPTARLPDSVDKARPAEIQRAVGFLQDALVDGPMPVTDLEAHYEFARHSEGQRTALLMSVQSSKPTSMDCPSA